MKDPWLHHRLTNLFGVWQKWVWPELSKRLVSEGTELAEQKALVLLTIPASRLALIWSQGPGGSCRSDAALRRLETGQEDWGVAAGSMLEEH